jgi:hypothetical protein
MAEETTTTTVPPTQPTLPLSGQYGATTTTTPRQSSNPTPAGGGGRISPSLSNQNIYTEDGADPYRYPIGVRGKGTFDENGKLISYEGYKYFSGPRYGTTSGAGAATGTPMIVKGEEKTPLYFSGDEDEIFGYSVEQISNLQRAMNGIGLLGKKYTPGVADNSTRAAYRNLLEQANGYGEDVGAAIIRMASAGAGQSRGNLTQYRVSSEADVKAIISATAKKLLGRNLGEGDLARLAQTYRNLEKETGLAAGSTTQQEVVGAPSVEAFAESQLGKMLPEETNARELGSYLEAIKERYQI